MKQDNEFNGLSKGYVKQIIRRSMLTKTKPSNKVYNRKKEKRGLASGE
jgi:hypothetical protein